MQLRIRRYRASLYQEADGWTGAISLGLAPDGSRRRIKRKAKTKKVVIAKLTEATRDLENGIHPSPSYTVERTVNDLLTNLAKRGRAPGTITTLRILADTHLIPHLGRTKAQDLTADDVESWLHERADHLATSTLRTLHQLLTRSLRRAERHDKVTRNVSALVDTPHGRRPGRPSKSMTIEQATALLTEALHGHHRLGPYIALGVLTGLRPEELRALRWDQIDLANATVNVVRSDRVGGDTKTPKSRRKLRISPLALDALATARTIQITDKHAAGRAYADCGLVFCHPDGRLLTAEQVRKQFRKVVEAASLDAKCWSPRELRHTFVSILSAHGIPIEKISDLVGHATTNTTQVVYRHQLHPVIEGGAEHMQRIFTEIRR